LLSFEIHLEFISIKFSFKTEELDEDEDDDEDDDEEEILLLINLY
jgi:hypothetical protein